MHLEVLGRYIDETIGRVLDGIAQQMGNMSARGRQQTFLAVRIGMPIANEVLDAVGDRFGQSVRIPLQLLAINGPSFSIGVELDDGEHIADKRLQPAILSSIMAD